MPLIWTDFTFTKIYDNQPVTFEFLNDLDWLRVNILSGGKTITYESNHIEYELPYLLDAILDIIPEYAPHDKYFHYRRNRSRVNFDAEIQGLVMWDFKNTNSSFDNPRIEILIRNNFDLDMEDDSWYYNQRDPESIEQVKGDIWLSASIELKQLAAALLQALDTLQQITPEKPDEDCKWCMALFPSKQYNMLKLWLDTPYDSYKWQKLNPGKKYFDNTEGVVIEPEDGP